MWGGVTGYGFLGGYPAVAQQVPAPAVHQPLNAGSGNLRYMTPHFAQSPFVFTASPPDDPPCRDQKADVTLPPPPPAAHTPWNAAHEKTVDVWRGVAQNSACSHGITSEPDGEPMMAGDVERILAHAMAHRKVDRLRQALSEASRSGMHGSTVQQARDMLLSLEAEERRQEAGQVVDEAIELDDWWKLQGALQQAVAADLPKVKIDGLRDAMQLHTRRKEAATGLRKAIENGDTEELRIAIEKALTGHVRQKDVDRAREALQELESRKADARRLEKARTKFEKQLQEAAAAKCPATLLAVIKASENGSNPDASALAKNVRMEAISAARAELRTQALENLRDLHQASDIEGLSAALKDAAELGVNEREILNYTERLQNLRKRQHHCQKLQTAVQVGEKRQLLTVVAEAEAAGLGDDENLKQARVALEEVQMKERKAEEKARALKQIADQKARAEKQDQEERTSASENLRRAYYEEDIDQLSSALARASNAGLSGVELAPAEEKMRVLRSRVGATAQLSEAIESRNVYKLRAAIASVSGSGVDEKILSQAKALLVTLNVHADLRHKLSSAVSSGQVTILTQAIEEARAQGLPRHEIAEAEAALRSATQANLGGNLQAAMEGGNVSRLRDAIASAAGMVGHQMEAAWERMRFLENNEWALRELRNAMATGDPVRLQVAISQAEQANIANDELDVARKELQTWVSQRHAQQELQLARASGNALTLRSALETAKAAGFTGALVEIAEKELRALERGSAWRPPPPLMSPPPPPPAKDEPGIDMDSEDEECASHHRDEFELGASPNVSERPQTDAQLHELPRTLTNPQLHEFPPRIITDQQMHKLPSRTLTDPHDHDVVPSIPRSPHMKMSWTPQMRPHPQPQADMFPPTDPQLHDFPSPPPAW